MTNVIDLGLERTYRADDVVIDILSALQAGDRELAGQLLAVARARLRGIPQGPRRKGLLRTLRIIRRHLA